MTLNVFLRSKAASGYALAIYSAISALCSRPRRPKAEDNRDLRTDGVILPAMLRASESLDNPPPGSHCTRLRKLMFASRTARFKLKGLRLASL